jgi:hypothetical protein
MWGSMADTEGFIFRFPRLRLGSLVVLTLVAGTLSARAWTLPAESDPGKKKPAQSSHHEPGKPEKPGKTDKPDKGNEGFVRIAPQADVWHGIAERPLVQRPLVVQERSFADVTNRPERRPALSASHHQLAPPADCRPGERHRLICRYSHAPPIDA